MNNTTMIVTLALPIIAAFLLILVGKCISAFMEQPDKPFTRLVTRRVESITLAIAALIVASAVLYQLMLPSSTAAGPAPALPHATLLCVSGSITIDGSTALAPLVSDVAQDYQTKCKQSSTTTITVNQSSSATGLSNVESGKINIANSDISALQTQGDLIDHRVAVVIFTVITSSDIGINNLTADQLYGIFHGTITNWSKVGGPELPITVFARTRSSGTRTTFNDYLLCSPDMPDVTNTHILETTSLVAKSVQAGHGAIGYVDLGTAVTSHLHFLSIDGASPVLEQVRLNHYKFWNIEHMYTKGIPAAGSLVNAFLQYMTNTPEEEPIANAHNYVNFNLMSNSGLASHQICTR